MQIVGPDPDGATQAYAVDDTDATQAYQFDDGEMSEEDEVYTLPEFSDARRTSSSTANLSCSIAKVLVFMLSKFLY